jgi:hypothetical protein
MASILARRMKAMAGGVACCLGLSLALPCLAAQEDPPAAGAPDQGDSVARIINGIISFTRWPDPSRKVRLCIVEPSRHADTLMRKTSSPAGPVQAQYLPPGDMRLQAGCDVVYIEHIESADHEKLLRRLVGRPVLTIAGSEAGCLMGSMFCVSSAATPVTFSANLLAITRSGLRVDPKVLLLVRRQPEK